MIVLPKIVCKSSGSYIFLLRKTLDNFSYKSERISFLSRFQGSSLFTANYKQVYITQYSQPVTTHVVKVARNYDSHLSLVIR